MSICTSFLTQSHQASIISQLKNTIDLPFKQMLPIEEIHQHLSRPKERKRVFTPLITFQMKSHPVIATSKGAI